jgi:uncharacterized protein (DUF1015 family)
MAEVKPFRAVLPAFDKANLIITKAVTSYSKRVLNVHLETNPFTFLHIILPEHGQKEKTPPTSEARFKKVKEKYKEFIKKSYLFEDEAPHFYLYEQIHKNRSYIGIISATSIEDYNNNVIKKHEQTITKREIMFKDYLKVCELNAEPVLLTYEDDNEINLLIQKYQQNKPDYDFSTIDQIRHKLWIISSEKDIKKIETRFSKIPSLYIADGHHRSASSARLADVKKTKNLKNSPYNYFMSFVIAQSQLNILDFNRLLKDIQPYNKKKFIEKLQTKFELKQSSSPDFKPTKKHEIGMFIGSNWYVLIPKKGTFDANCPVSSLDSEILFQHVFKELLQINDLKTSTKVAFVDGTKTPKYLAEQVKSEKFAVAFNLYPVQIEELKKIADKNLIMPPKTTWIEPKLPSGLTIYQF